MDNGISVKAAANEINKSTMTIRRMVENGTLHFVGKSKQAYLVNLDGIREIKERQRIRVTNWLREDW